LSEILLLLPDFYALFTTTIRLRFDGRSTMFEYLSKVIKVTVT